MIILQEEKTMRKLRYGLIALLLLLFTASGATAGVSIGIGFPNVSIGINLPVFPELVRVPGYPVYYAPEMDANYFFYDGMYWVYQDDNWYASSWYNGPWGFVEPEFVPLYILRIPVRYYRQPPVYFRGWQSNAPPRWGQHWGPGWERNHRGWNKWNRRSVPTPAPLPVYQRQYSGDRYPHLEQQRTLRAQQYRFQPRSKVVREHFNQQVQNTAPAPAQQRRRTETEQRNQPQQNAPYSAPRQQSAPVYPQSQLPQRGAEQQRSAPQPAAQHRAPAVREQPSGYDQKQYRERPARYEQQDRDEQENRGHGGQRNDDDRGHGRNR